MSELRIDIDNLSGFCFGVTSAISKAEEELSKGVGLFCLGDIVHNSAEVNRLTQKGLRTISHSELTSLSPDARVLLRAHGEPPSTYKELRARGVTIVDATCPVVLKLQQRIKEAYDESRTSNHPLQIVIYGQPGHAEVNGLVGQTDGNAIVIEGPDQLDKIDMSVDIALYSQTTKSLEGFSRIIEAINRAKNPDTVFTWYDTICRSVSNRVNRLKEFASSHDVVLFVAGEKSSNGKVLFNLCRSVNPRSFLLSGPTSLMSDWLRGARSIGICGATSTPRWLMEEVAEKCKILSNTI